MVRHAVRLVLIGLVFLLAVALLVAMSVSVTVSVPASGVLEPRTMWPVRVRESGSLAALTVSTGDVVQAGEVVGQLDPLDISTESATLAAVIHRHELEVRRAEAAVSDEARQRGIRTAQAGVRLIQARAVFRERLLPYGLNGPVDSLVRSYAEGAHIEVDRAIAELRSAEAEVRFAGEEAASASIAALSLAQAQGDLVAARERQRLLAQRQERLDVIAPAAGVVLTSELESLVGSTVRVGDVVLVVADTTAWRAVLVVGEQRVNDIALGDSVMLRIPALRRIGADRIAGVVTSISQVPREAGTGSSRPLGSGYEVVVTIPSTPLGMLSEMVLRSGFTVEGRVVAKTGRIIELLADYLWSIGNGVR